MSVRKYLPSFGAVLGGNVLASAFGLIVSIILIRALAPHDFGIYSVAISTSLLLMMLLDLGINNGFVVLASQQRLAGKGFSSLTSALLASKLLIGCIIAIPILAFSGVLSDAFFGGKNNAHILYLALILTILMAVWSFFQSVLQAKGRYGELALVTLGNNLARLVCIMAAFVLPGNLDLVKAMTATVVGVILVTILAFARNLYDGFLELRPNWRVASGYSRRLFDISKWNAISMLATMLLMRMDVFLLQALSSPVQVAYYSGALQLANVFPLLTGAITTTLLPKVSSLSSTEQLSSYTRKVVKAIPVVAILTALVVFAAGPLIPLVLGENYRGSVPIFQLLVVAFAMSVIANPLSLCFFALNKIHYLTFLAYIQLGLGLILNISLIPHFDALAPALASVIYRAVGGAIVLGLIFYLFRSNGEDNGQIKGQP